ncbi:MAG: circadian clock protein KaiC [Nitrospinota bacterium]|nr:circadian clock protein KaiC [Nitrospinota bacterium]MDH5757057.1 circadian clock protein KaiC [Nitrospinota bacterium]
MSELYDVNVGEQLPKLATGILGFDDIAAGGLPQGRATLLTGSSGSCKTLFSVQFLYESITLFDEGAVFITLEETPAEIMKNVKSFGWDLRKLVDSNKLAFVDASPEPGESTSVVGEYDFSALLARIEHAAKRVNATRVAIDSLSAIFSQFSDSRHVRSELFRVTAGLKKMGLTSIITAERSDEYGDISRYGVEEFVSDNVIVLRNVAEAERRRRTVEVLKFRGAGHQKGEYPFTLTGNGIEVLPLSALELTMPSSEVRLSAGNPDLDRMCGGGFFRDSIIMASGATGTGKTLLVTTYLNDGCMKGERTLVYAFEESRDQLLRNARGWGMDFSRWEKEGLLKIVCAYPEIRSLPDHLLSMKAEIEEFKPNRIAIDSLSAMERVSVGKSFSEFVIGITSFIKHKETAGLFTVVPSSMHSVTSVSESHISSLTDSIILLRYVELMGQMRRGLTVLKMRGSAHEKEIREFTINDKGMHIGDQFHNVGGILTGAPMHIISGESDKLSGMFQK